MTGEPVHTVLEWKEWHQAFFPMIYEEKNTEKVEIQKTNNYTTSYQTELLHTYKLTL